MMNTDLHWAILKVFADGIKPDNSKWVGGPQHDNCNPLHIGFDERCDLIQDHLVKTLPGYDRYVWAQAEEADDRYTKETDTVIDEFIQVYENAFDEVVKEVQQYVSNLALTALASQEKETKYFVLRVCWSQTDQPTVIVEHTDLEEAKAMLLSQRQGAHHIDKVAICDPKIVRF